MELNIKEFYKEVSLRAAPVQGGKEVGLGRGPRWTADTTAPFGARGYAQLGQDGRILRHRIEQSLALSCTGKGPGLRKGGSLQLR